MPFKKAKIAIIDYDLGNTQSVSNALEFLGYKTIISDKKEVLMTADALILPGVGAFEIAMNAIKQRNLIEILSEIVLIHKKPILGICLGMQLLATTSEENAPENNPHKGLDFIAGNVRKITPTLHASVPHVGWNNIESTQNSVLYERLNQNSNQNNGQNNQNDNQNNQSKNFYFDHTFYFDCDAKYQSSVCDYGGLKLTAAVQKDNIFGVQFHPEKSQNNGLRLFRGFIENI